MSARSVRYPRKLIAYWMAIAFALRALLPHGFMPGSEPFTLKLCPAGLPAQVSLQTPAPADAHAEHHPHHEQHGQDAQNDHQSHHQRADQCPFGAASGGMVLAQVLQHTVAWLGSTTYSLPLLVSDPDPHPAYRPQPRGPPAFS